MKFKKFCKYCEIIPLKDWSNWVSMNLGKYIDMFGLGGLVQVLLRLTSLGWVQVKGSNVTRLSVRI